MQFFDPVWKKQEQKIPNNLTSDFFSSFFFKKLLLKCLTDSDFHKSTSGFGI